MQWSSVRTFLRRKYISEEEFNEHYDFAFNLMNMIVAFKNKIN